MRSTQNARAAMTAVLALAASGCGSSASSSTSPAASTSGTASAGPGSSSASASSPAALSADAHAAATGDIPDNQVFLAFTDKLAGYSIKYPEGWAQKGSGRSVVFQDKNTLARVVVQTGPPPTTASVHADMAALRRKEPSLRFQERPDGFGRRLPQK